MAQATTKDLTTLPVGRLGLIPLISCQALGEKVNEWLVQWRKERSHEELILLHLRDIREIPIHDMSKQHVSVPVKEKVRSWNLYVVTISILWLMYATTVLPTASADTPT